MEQQQHQIALTLPLSVQQEIEQRAAAHNRSAVEEVLFLLSGVITPKKHST